jgi:prepilin-type N-terminal cleavage/methylation domain-containing protein
MKREGGFTLIELVITTVVLSLIFMAIFSMLSSVRIVNARSNNLTVASEAAQQQLESYRNLSYGDINLGTVNTTTQLASFASLGATRSSSVTVTTEDPAGLKRVAVNVTYSDRGRTSTLNLTTLVAENGINK